MASLILFFKGFIIGVGKIIPGVSGSVLAISLGVYEEAMKRIDSLFRSFRENIRYLMPLAFGILLAVLLGSNVILYCLEHYYLYTMSLFVGLILGTLPGLIKKQHFQSKDWIFIVLVFLFMYVIYNSIVLPEFVPTNSLFTYLYIVFLGFLDAATTIMPGISGTATYMVLGSYNFILKLFANPFGQIFFAVLFGLGLIIGFVLMIKFVNFCFSKYAHQTWCVIIAFLLSSLYFLFLKMIDYVNATNVFSIMCLFVFSYYLINSLDN